jgi:hypothetical protein
VKKSVVDNIGPYLQKVSSSVKLACENIEDFYKKKLLRQTERRSARAFGAR